MKIRDFDTIRASKTRFSENRGLKGGAEHTVFFIEIIQHLFCPSFRSKTWC